MYAGCKVLILGLLVEVLALGARAQAPTPLPMRALQSVAPTDTTFAELNFLQTEIGNARVVFLGEPTHGEGNVLAAKARLLAFLQQRMGFTTLGMESGFFDLYKAQRAISVGKSVPKNLQSSVFSVWTRTREFQAVVPLVGPDGFRIMGFDPQLSGDYSDDIIDDLEDFLEESKGAKDINFELLGEAASYMEEHFAFPPTQPLAGFEAELDKAEPLLRQAAAAPNAARRTEAVFWQQCLRSLRALARDYATHNPSDKTAADFVAADSNPRDAQMADNLLWYLRQHPTEKVVCWGALPHFANHVEVLGTDELRAYQPMGRAVKAALGPNQVYILGTLAGGGTHGPAGTAGQPVPTPAPGTLEANLLALNSPYGFVSLKHNAPGLQLTTYAFDYQPLAGPWSEVVDGFLFLQSVEPPHLLAADSTAAVAAVAKGDSAAAAGHQPGSLNPAPGRGAATMRRAVAVADVSGVRTVRGVVLDQRRRLPVPYASVQLAGQGRGTVADAQGRFSLALPGPTELQISSLGYEVATVQSPRGSEELTVLLTPASYALEEVRVASARPLSAAEILQRVAKRIPQNYEQQDYTAEVYTYRRFSSFDTLRAEIETVSRVRVPTGYRHFTQGFLGQEDGVTVQPEQRHVLTERGGPLTLASMPALYTGTQGAAFSAADPVRTSPLFGRRGARRFVLKLDSVRRQGADTLYVLSFAVRHGDHRSTGTYLMSGYQGRLLVRARDYAVLRYEALWQADTAAINATARKNYGRPNAVAAHYPHMFTADRTTHIVDYAKAANGRYYVHRSVGQTLNAGRTLGRGPFYSQSLTEHYFRVLPEAGAAPAPIPKEKVPATPPPAPYRPEFWVDYQRPGGPLAGAIPAGARSVAQP